MSKTAKYVSAKLQEYRINQSGNFWVIDPYKGGVRPKALRGNFTSFGEAERHLINWLKKTDKFGNRAVYPEYG